jgi:hypothetical protein
MVKLSNDDKGENVVMKCCTVAGRGRGPGWLQVEQSNVAAERAGGEEQWAQG